MTGIVFAFVFFGLCTVVLIVKAKSFWRLSAGEIGLWRRVKKSVANRESVDWGQARREPRRWFFEVIVACGIVVVFYALASVTGATLSLIAAMLVGLGVLFVFRRRG